MNTYLHQITKQIRTHAENRHERFCKKDRRPVKPWRRQKGGKGVATSVGIYFVCCPIAIILGLTVFALMVFISKIVSLSSLIATVTVITLSIVFYDNPANILIPAVLSVAI